MGRWRGIGTLLIVITAMLAFAAAPLSAQGKKKSKDRDERTRIERVIRGDIYDRAPARRGNGAGKVPPGWCRGVGNPHNTRANCGYRSGDRDSDRRRDRYDDRRRERYDDRDRRGSYSREHDDFHYRLDRKYRELAARRPLDLEYQLRVRAEKAREHDNWHRRTGVRH